MSGIKITDTDWYDPEGLPETKIDLRNLPNPHTPKPKIKTADSPAISPRALYEQQQADRLNPEQAQAVPYQPDPEMPQFIAPGNSPQHKAMRAQLEQQGMVAPEEPSAEPKPNKIEYETDPRYVTNRQAADTRYMRISLPSKFIFYDFDWLNMRPFEVRDLAKLSRAQAENNISILLDVMDGTLDRDVRSLTVGDFYYLLYMIRIWSYPRSPFTLKWRSKYGNMNEYTINRTNLVENEPKLNKEEYQAWVARGYTVPTVRDMEVFQTETLDPELKWTYERAQYLAGATIREKLDRLAEPDGIALLEDIRDFSALLDHGPVESIEVEDRAFNPLSWAAALNTQLEQIKALGYKNNPQLAAQYNVVSAELDSVNQKISRKQAIRPDKEVIRISVDLMSFFPSV